MSTTEEPEQLYAKREPIFPRRVKGNFRTLKWWLMGLMLGIYYITPWIRWDRGPAMPDQAVLVDLGSRRFFFFMVEIWPHEFYFVAGLLIMAGIGLFLFTSALGRVWCGYACPQTVWTDLYILVERWVEGDRNARLRLHRQPWNAEKIRKNLTKWLLWLLIGLATGGAWVFYFTDAPTLLHDLASFSAHPVAYGTIAFLTATTFLFGGFFREQVCIYGCPWPRIQAAMMDEDTLTISYRDWRGEPRGKHHKGVEDTRQGDCIDCMACVNVCPMGIDIRDGQQLACITCGLCIDACNDVMDRIGKPRELIGYMALTDETRERAGSAPKSIWKHVFRPRTVVYTVLWAGVGLALLVALFLRTDIDMSIAPVRNPTHVVLANGSVRNAYDIRLRNMYAEPRQFYLTVANDASISLTIEGVQGQLVTVGPDEQLNQRVYLTAAAGTPAAVAATSPVRLWVSVTGETDRIYGDTVFNGRGE
ncbi:cytochrome c oxidase accessory protein CcoG [Pararhodobacter zhoushanensis]|uniref:Cytochrome c oxidase accessory protein CcoG n=1 Tax=Pararhodobacter zhoushanensis TaxID=2479545 RepID=A0ABT3H501_9RHOB|nr:cytochrome c oxidase accessory protein CcoG [Pararhodobacter zhoushanensis]MCW1934854.1 cytochrome c oxidase accessory protein CcoG [Pararhodobacter zhoushanensis]